MEFCFQMQLNAVQRYADHFLFSFSFYFFFYFLPEFSVPSLLFHFSTGFSPKPFWETNRRKCRNAKQDPLLWPLLSAVPGESHTALCAPHRLHAPHSPPAPCAPWMRRFCLDRKFLVLNSSTSNGVQMPRAGRSSCDSPAVWLQHRAVALGCWVRAPAQPLCNLAPASLRAAEDPRAVPAPMLLRAVLASPSAFVFPLPQLSHCSSYKVQSNCSYISPLLSDVACTPAHNSRERFMSCTK